jgi:hypothetical protein
MRKLRLLDILLLTLAVGIFAYFLYDTWVLIYLKYRGEPTLATVTKLPIDCNKRSRIEISIAGRIYPLGVGTRGCNKDGLYVGKQLTVLKHEKYDRVAWTGMYPEILPVFILLVILYHVFVTRRYLTDPPKQQNIKKIRRK